MVPQFRVVGLPCFQVWFQAVEMVLVALEVGLVAEKPGKQGKFVLRDNEQCSLFPSKEQVT